MQIRVMGEWGEVMEMVDKLSEWLRRDYYVRISKPYPNRDGTYRVYLTLVRK